MVYGDWLYERREFRQAAAGRYRIFIICARRLMSFLSLQSSWKPKGHKRRWWRMRRHWNGKIYLSWRCDIRSWLARKTSRLWRIVYRVRWAVSTVDDLLTLSEDLVSKKRFAEAARLILDYTTDVRMAVITLVQGNEFSEALRIVSLVFGCPSVIFNWIFRLL